MKTLVSNLLILSTSFAMMGCGSKSASTKLEVSQSFAITNPYFAGGLIVSGEHLATGKTFSHSILNSKEMRIQLDPGTWKISAVGWDGGNNGNEKLFAGNPHCGTVKAELESSSAVVDLVINQANCNEDEFTAGYEDSASGELMKLHGIATCNSFHYPNVLPTSLVATSIMSDGAADDDCDNSTTPLDLKSRVKALKVYAIEKLPDDLNMNAGFSSECIYGTAGLESFLKPNTSGHPYDGYDLKLPFSNLPLMITTFKDSSCTQPMANYHFDKGLSPKYADFDHLLRQESSMTLIKLILPGNKLKRAFTPFMAIMPLMTKSTGLSFDVRPSPSGTIRLHGTSGPNIIHIKRTASCQGPLGITGTGTFSSVSCSVLPDNSGVTISFTATSPTGVGTVSINGDSYPISFNADAGRPETNAGQKLALELVGQSGSQDLIGLFQLKDSEDKDYGALSAVRDMFSADGAGGVVGLSDISDPSLTFYDACQNASGEKKISIYEEEELQFKTYRVSVDDINTSPSNFICNNGNVNPPNCIASPMLEKQMTIYDYQISATEPSMVIKFSCSNKLGHLETRSADVRSNEIEEIKEIINWNSHELNFQRFERLKLENISHLSGTGTWIHVEESRRMDRLIKIGPDDFQAWHYGFNSQRNIGDTNYMQRLETRRIKTSGSFLYTQSNAETPISHASRTQILTGGTAFYTSLPADITSADKIPAGATFPQTITPVTASPVFNGYATSFPNGSLFNDTVDFKPIKLGVSTTPNFMDSFGANFLSAP